MTGRREASGSRLNYEVETHLTMIRAAKTARQAINVDRPGNVFRTDCAIFKTATHVIPVQPGIEPGTPLPPGVHADNWTAGKPDAPQFSGTRYLIVGKPGQKVPEPSCRNAQGKTVPVPPGFTNLEARTLPPARLRAAIREFVLDGDRHLDMMQRQLRGFVAKIAKTVVNHQHIHSHEDRLQDGLEIAQKEINKFISPQRPAVLFHKALALRLQRDLQRRSAAGMGISQESAKLAVWIDNQQITNPGTATPEELAAARMADPNVQSRRKEYTGDKTVNVVIKPSDVTPNKRQVTAMARALAVKERLKANQSIDGSADNDGFSLSDIIPDETSDIDQASSREDHSEILRRWMSGSGLTPTVIQRLIPSISWWEQLGGSLAPSDITTPRGRDLAWALTPLLRTDESWDEDTHIKNVTNRFRNILMSVRGLRESDEVAIAWRTYLENPEFRQRPDGPEYLSSVS
jgi:hypothetical protein